MRFRKHYLDVVTPDDRVRILYVVELEVVGLAVRCAGVLRSDPGDAAARSATTVTDVVDPTYEGATTRWASRSLDVSYTVARTVRGPEVDLLPGGGLCWNCHTLRGDVTLTDGGEALTGTGYAETIEGRVAPWDLPWDTLAWGRVHDDDGATIWTILDGGGADRRVFASGTEPRAAGKIPQLETIRELRTGRIGDTVLSTLPFVEKLPGRILGLRETKLYGRSATGGRAIFETVRFAPRKDR